MSSSPNSGGEGGSDDASEFEEKIENTKLSKEARDKALAEMADDPNARKAFLYWTYTFDEFLKEAEAIHGKKKS